MRDEQDVLWSPSNPLKSNFGNTVALRTKVYGQNAVEQTPQNHIFVPLFCLFTPLVICFYLTPIAASRVVHDWKE
jgi:hypothetical protein